MMSESQRFTVLVYLIIGAVVGVALSALFVMMSSNHFYWIFVPIAIAVVFMQGFVRTKRGLE